MSSISKYTSYATWTVEELVDAASTNPRGNRKVTIPEFQRRLVWPKAKQEALIDSIKSGFPFGSLLLYKDPDTSGAEERYKLIDGLQRTQTLRQYSDHPNRSFSNDEVTDEFLEFVANALDPFSEIDCLSEQSKADLRRLMREWVWGSRGFTEAHGWGASALTEHLLSEIVGLEEETFEFFRARKELVDFNGAFRKRLEAFLDSIQQTSDLGKVGVPVIVYTGPSANLAEVFIRLNREGIKLSRYEIYAAQWLDHRYRIENPDIIKAIWDKYRALEAYGFSLDVSAATPDAQSRLERDYTLFEYLFGLGQCLTQMFAHFFKPVNVDEPSPVAFNLMSACIGEGVAEKQVRDLPQVIRGLDLSRLEECLMESVEFVSRLLKPVLSVKRYGQNKDAYFHPDNLIITVIATAFRVRYNKNDLSENEGWESKRDTLAKHLPMYYLDEVLHRENWGGAGDKRLADILRNEKFLKLPPSDTEWTQALDVWFKNNLNNQQQGKKYIKDDWPEYLLLRFVFVHRLKHTESYHVQHIVPISRLTSPPSYYHQNDGPINTIGNLALVTEEDFVEYGDLTFADYLKRQQREGVLGTIQFHDTLESQEKCLVCKASHLPSWSLKKREFEEFLAKRFELLKREFLTVWRDHIPADPQT